MLEITRSALARLVEEAEREAPRESCGLLLGKGARIETISPALNVDEQPELRFEIDPHELIAAHRRARAGGPELIGYYHSHPGGDPVPSALDCERAGGDNRVWAIVARGEVAFWRDSAGFEPLFYRVIDG